MSNRINLYLPEGHYLLNIPKEKRAAKAKELIDFAIKYQDNMTQILTKLSEIQEMLKNGVTSNVPPILSEKVQNADLNLIMNLVK